jgi:hypothetical protein
MTPRRSTYRVLALAGVVAVAACAGGCRDRGPAPGGATNRKAREARQQAEQMAVDGVKGAAAELFANHPDLDRRTTAQKVADYVTSAASAVLPGKAAPATAKVNATPAAPPPAPPAAPARPDESSAVVVASARPPAPAADPKPSGNVVIREKVSSNLARPDPAAADDDALEQAAARIEQRLRELDPPVLYRPSAGVVRNEYVRRGSRAVVDPSDAEKKLLGQEGKGDWKYVEYTVEVTADQVRELRARARVGSALRVLGVVAGVALAGFLFLRLDEWTKGYLTSWLAFAAVALAGGVAAALVLV